VIGNNVKLFQTLKGLIPVNDGKRECGPRVSNCYDEQAPSPFDKYTMVNLFAGEWDICSIRAGFLTLRSSHKIQLLKRDAGDFAFQDSMGPGLLKLFVGYNSSGQALRELNIWVGTTPAGYHSKRVAQESFAYSTVRGWSEKGKKRFVNTLYV
jgi:hypothetical protein